MMRPAGQEKTAMEEDVFTHSSLETGAMVLHGRPPGEAPRSISGQKEKGESMSKRLHYGF